VILWPDTFTNHFLADTGKAAVEVLEDAGYRVTLPGRALVHAHCHHAAVLGLDAEIAVLDKLGLDYRLLDSGCCGMSGAFGFQREKYRISLAIGEQRLLPAVRRADADVLLIADGFSCREQIRQGTGRRTQHLAQVLQGAIRRRDHAAPIIKENTHES